jgi:hypothetical protein
MTPKERKEWSFLEQLGAKFNILGLKCELWKYFHY